MEHDYKNDKIPKSCTLSFHQKFNFDPTQHLPLGLGSKPQIFQQFWTLQKWFVLW